MSLTRQFRDRALMGMLTMGAGRSAGGAGGPAFVGALDAYSAGMSGAWSVSRRLRSSYSGPLIRVRRSGDNEESDIGYGATGALDSAALTAFTGAEDAYVTCVYDQSGNGRDFTQSSASQQPMIVVAGAIHLAGGKAAVVCDPTFEMHLTLSSGVQAGTWITTAQYQGSDDYPGLITGSSIVLIGGISGISLFEPDVAAYAYYVDGVDETGDLTPFGYDLRCYTLTGTALTEAWLWGSERGIPGRFWNGYLSELVTYQGTPAFRADVEAALMAHLGL